MRVTLSPLLRIAILVFVVCPILAWAAVRPARVILPEVGSDIICVDAAVCVDDVSKLDSARALYTEAVSFVAQHIGGIEGRPKVVFCSTQACADHFGLGARSAVTVGQFGSVAVLPFLSDEAFRYYIQAFMIYDLKGEIHYNNVVFHLTFGLQDQSAAEPLNPRRYGSRTLRDVAVYRNSMFSPAQAGAIVEYLKCKLTAEEPDGFDAPAIRQALDNYWFPRAELPGA